LAGFSGWKKLGSMASSPVVLSEAKRMALAALDRYDPKQGTKITTFLHSQLQGLKRYQRKQVQAIRSSEHMLLQSGRVAGAESELEGELGRPPSETEIARRLDIPLSRLKQIRQQIRGEVAEGRFAQTDSGQAGETPLLVAMNARSLWPELVHADLDPTNQFILEHTLGLFGRPKLKNAEIARRLRVSPGAISQRKSLIQKLLDREQELSPFLED
jgi:DNA-directed RNA polymerase specialized sigma subunit